MGAMKEDGTLAPTLIDLFAGAGGLTLGFVEAGFEPLMAVESDEWAAKTYKTNFGAHVLDRPIETVDEFSRADVVIGGPPCQGFSPLGRKGSESRRSDLNQMWKHYLRAVRKMKPRVFLVENVPEFLTSEQYVSFKRSCSQGLPEYDLEERVLNAAEFGVPQTRRRGFILGSRIGKVSWPEPTHGDGLLTAQRFVTTREAIGDLSPEPDDESMHWRRHPQPISLERYKVIPPGGNRFDLAARRPDLLPDCWRRKTSGSTDVFGRLWWDRPSCTIRTEFYKPEKGRYLHPEEDRPITHREAARLQTFPDSFVFQGSKTQIARQIGNAVPPKLGEALARSIRTALEATTSS